jgi:radical SAM superfamily enzyme YgiQ (UPF0313 family)
MLDLSRAACPASQKVPRSFEFATDPCRRLVVILVRPSKYDDDGYVVRHWRGTLPSNTLSCLNSLTEDVVKQGDLGAVDVHVEVIDEIVDRVNVAALGRRFRQPGTRTVVGLVGVQTNQFPRARDLAGQFLAEGFAVMIGGFHVSGAIAMAPEMPPECQEAMDAGVTLVIGEVDDAWSSILQDVVFGRLQPLYNLLDALPDLHAKPIPRPSFGTQQKFVNKGSGTIDAGRGCPFNCSFCTIINVQGRRMRSRSAAHILKQIRENYNLDGRRKGVHHYFFTDDNFARNPQWEAIFDGLIVLREQDGMPVNFMMQVDVLASRLPGFVEKAARAGCGQVFIGIETLRDDNLAAGAKRQNQVADYREMVDAWHQAGVMCHAGYIIGFPNDTYDRVMEDVRALHDDLLVDQASFFMLTPLPGSRDHAAAVASGLSMETDLNLFDASHATVPHPRMTRDEWYRAYRDAWTTFYAFDPMRRSLLRQPAHTYAALFKNLIWYQAGMSEHAHPMVTGFVRLKDRLSRRPGLPIEGRGVFLRRRIREVTAQLRDYAGICYEMLKLRRLTRTRRPNHVTLGDLRQFVPEPIREAART